MEQSICRRIRCPRQNMNKMECMETCEHLRKYQNTSSAKRASNLTAVRPGRSKRNLPKSRND